MTKKDLFGNLSLLVILITCGIVTPSGRTYADVVAGPVLWNRLGSDTQVQNSEIGVDGTIAGTVSYDAGRFGGSLEIDRPDASNIVSFPDYEKTNAGTIEFWGKGLSLGVPKMEADYWFDSIPETPAAERVGALFSATGSLQFVLGDAFVFTASPFPTTIPPNTWRHYAFVWDADGIEGTSDTVRIYYENALVASGTDSFDVTGENDGFRLGLSLVNDHPMDDGFIDNLKIFDYAKTDFSDRLVERPPPVLWNRLGSDTQVQNSEIGVDGTIAGTVSYDAGRFGGSLEIDGPDASNIVSFPDYEKTNAGTIEFWGKGLSLGVPKMEADYWFDSIPGTPAAERVGALFSATGSLQFVVGDAFVFTESPFPTTIPPNEWVHYAFVWDADGIEGTSDTVRIYYENALVASGTDSFDVTGENDGVRLGLSLLDDYAMDDGFIDNLKIFDYAKTNFPDRLTESPFGILVPGLHNLGLITLAVLLVGAMYFTSRAWGASRVGETAT